MTDPIEVSIVRNPITPMRSTFEYDAFVFSPYDHDRHRLLAEINALGAQGFQLVRVVPLDKGLPGKIAIMLLFEKWCPIIEEADVGQN